MVSPSLISITEPELMEFYSDGAWIRVPKQFFIIMSPAEAMFLANLINFSHYQKRKATEQRKEYDGWFFYTKDWITNDIYLTHYQQQRLFRSLKEKGLIKTKWKGNPAKRYIKVMAKAIHKQIKEGLEKILPVKEPRLRKHHMGR